MKRKLLFLKASAFLLFLAAAPGVQAQYCIPTYDTGCSDGDEINDFEIVGSGLNHVGSGCSVDAYADYTADMGLVANLEATVEYEFTITHNYDDQWVKIWIDFNEDEDFDDTELVFESATPSAMYETSGTITIPFSVSPVNGLRMRVVDTYSELPPSSCVSSVDVTYGETHDYTVNILPPPPCPYPSDFSILSATPVSAIVGWTEQGSATEYNVEWLIPGFMPGTGAEIGAATVTSGVTSYEITGLTAGTTYDVYVRADCDVNGVSGWVGPLTLVTPLCDAIATLPWTEDFETFTDIGMYTYPDCWSQENIGGTDGWNVHDNAFAGTDADAYSGTNFLAVEGYSDAYIWTPSFELTAGETYQFKFNWAGDYSTGWIAEVLVNNSPISDGATTLEMFLEEGWWTEPYYYEQMYCFNAPSTGTYTFAIHVTELYGGSYLSFDDFSLEHITGTAGTSVAYDMCVTESFIDLDAVGTITETGYWEYPANPYALNWPSTLDVSMLPLNSQATFFPDGCYEEVTVDIALTNLSSAGADGTVESCMNQQIDLLAGLSFGAMLGGTWYDEDDNALTDTYFMTGTTPGDYDYTYVAGNGVCPDDTALITLTILTCDYLTNGEMSIADVAIYPNPSTGMFTVTPAANFGDYTMVVTDLNGRVVMTTSVKSAQNASAQIDLTDMENGVYMLRIFNEEQAGVFKLIKN